MTHRLLPIPVRQRLLACFCHAVGGIAAAFIPANLFITYALARILRQDAFVRRHAEQAADFNLSVTVYALGGLFVYALLMLGAGDIAQALNVGLSSTEIDAISKNIVQGLLGLVTVAYAILVFVASTRALFGREHCYPFSLGWYQLAENALRGSSTDEQQGRDRD